MAGLIRTFLTDREKLNKHIWSFDIYTELPGFKKKTNVVYATNISKGFLTSYEPRRKKIC